MLAESKRVRSRLAALAAMVTLMVLLVLPASAGASVRLLFVTSPLRAGTDAIVVVVVKPARLCSITVHYKSGPSHARGLYPKRPNAAGKVGWAWLATPGPGRWPITISCGTAGTLRTSLVVR